MHPPSPSPILALLTLLLPPSTLAFPTVPSNPIASNSYLASTWAPPPATCLLPPPSQPPPYTLDPSWSAGMKSCLSDLNNLGWNGVHCVPSDTTASPNPANPSDPNSPFTPPPNQPSTSTTQSSTPSSQDTQPPTVGFYKGADDNFKKLHLEGNDCYNACEACLEMGIEGGVGGVKCRWVPAEGASCWMGFEVGG